MGELRFGSTEEQVKMSELKKQVMQKIDDCNSLIEKIPGTAHGFAKGTTTRFYGLIKEIEDVYEKMKAAGELKKTDIGPGLVLNSLKYRFTVEQFKWLLENKTTADFKKTCLDFDNGDFGVKTQALDKANEVLKKVFGNAVPALEKSQMDKILGDKGVETLLK